MKILYYCWDEITSLDIIDVFKQLDYNVTTFRYELSNKLEDYVFTTELTQLLDNDSYDLIFSFNYFPVISKCANTHNIKYVSWIFDSPNLTLYSNTIFNSCNYVFSFDNDEVERLRAYGATTVYHMPLAVNVTRLDKMLSETITSNDSKCSINTPSSNYKYDITFLGTLYNDAFNFYDQIGYMPSYYKGYFEGIINTQMNMYGVDLPSIMITDDIMKELKPHINISLIDEIFLKEKDFFIQILQKKITVTERLEILRMICKKHTLTHFAHSTSPLLNNIDFKGYADYMTEMPYIFNSSKINLNISLRSIQSGIPLRCMDIMGAGGFLLSNYQKELAYFFEPDKEVVLYDSRTDLMHKIDYYLNHDDEREEIAHNGKIKIADQFSYTKVIPNILNIVLNR